VTLVLLPVASFAATFTLALDTEFSGATAPVSGTTPWVTATFDDSFGGPNTVRLTMTADNLTGGTNGENLELFYFNFDPSLDPTALIFTAVDVSASNPENGKGDNGIFTGVNAFMANGDGNYDIAFNFPPPPGSGGNRFTGGESVIYDISYTSSVAASAVSRWPRRSPSWEPRCASSSKRPPSLRLARGLRSRPTGTRC
jgi:hypothetical protein